MCVRIVLFFFSSRRRHTRFDCDWSSDVCSSDLRAGPAPVVPGAHHQNVVCAWTLLFDRRDRKSTRLNSSHSQISYAVFCLKKKKKKENNAHRSLNVESESTPEYRIRPTWQRHVS